jgi:beta-aspartyl-peptidase (threonine type)
MKKAGRVAGVFLLLWTTLAAAQTAAGAETVSPPELAIRAELAEQVSAWNRGDLKGYMQGYWHSPELTFFAGDKESTGWDAAYQRYRAAYLGKDREMGKLNFANLRIEMLGGQAAFVRGTWQLTMKDGSQRRGLFTVVLRKFDDGWRIIHDHSS